MLAFSHAIAGAAIAAKTTGNPALGYFLALASHPLLDLVPHWDFNSRHNGRSAAKTVIISLTDAAIGFIIGFTLFGDVVAPGVLLATMLIAQLPDWLEAPLHVFNWKFPPFSTIKKIQHILHWKLASPWGILTQLIFLLFVILFAK